MLHFVARLKSSVHVHSVLFLSCSLESTPQVLSSSLLEITFINMSQWPPLSKSNSPLSSSYLTYQQHLLQLIAPSFWEYLFHLDSITWYSSFSSYYSLVTTSQSPLLDVLFFSTSKCLRLQDSGLRQILYLHPFLMDLFLLLVLNTIHFKCISPVKAGFQTYLSSCLLDTFTLCI